MVLWKLCFGFMIIFGKIQATKLYLKQNLYYLTYLY